MSNQYYVYIMANAARTLHTGVKNNLQRRAGEHKSGQGSTFTAKYCIARLVYYEAYDDIRDAIAGEKQIKGWRRSEKVALIESQNPDWRDISLDWLVPR